MGIVYAGRIICNKVNIKEWDTALKISRPYPCCYPNAWVRQYNSILIKKQPVRLKKSNLQVVLCYTVNSSMIHSCFLSVLSLS